MTHSPNLQEQFGKFLFPPTLIEILRLRIFTPAVILRFLRPFPPARFPAYSHRPRALSRQKEADAPKWTRPRKEIKK